MFWARSLLMFLLLSSCSPGHRTAMPDLKHAETSFKEEPRNPVRIKKVRGFITTEDGLSKIADRQIRISMNAELSLKEFFQLLVYQGINVVTRFTEDPPPGKKGEKKKEVRGIVKDKIFIADYSGSLKRLLKRVQVSSGLFYDYSDSVLIVKETSPVYVKVVMPGIQDELIRLLESYGIENAFYDRLSNRIVFESDYFKYSKLRDYFMNNNYLTLVNFDVLVLESESEKTRDRGIDWTKFSLVLDEVMRKKARLNIDSAAGDGSYSFTFDGDVLSLGGFYHNLQELHDFRIVQSARISSLNGKACVLDVSEKVPYVSEVTLGSLNDNSDNVVQGYTFGTAVSGLVITLKPNVADDFITLDFRAEIQNIAEYVKVGTENQFQQPVVSVRNIDNDIIITPGRIQLVGGLKYTKGDIRRSGLVDVSEKLGLRSRSDREFTLSVLLRSEIIKYVFI